MTTDWIIPGHLCDQSGEIAKQQRRIAELEMQVKDLRAYEVAKDRIIAQLRDRIAELEAQNIDLLEEVVDALQDVVFFVPRPTTTSAHADKVLPKYEQQLKKARGEA